MAANNQLDEGFLEVPHHELDAGFEEQPLDEKPSLQRDVGDVGRGLAQGVSLGASDEIVAALKAGYDVASGGADPTKHLSELYHKYQQIEQEKNKKAQERSPYLYGGGELAGGLGMGLLTAGGGIGAAGEVGLTEIAKQGGIKAALKELGKRSAISGAEMVPVGGFQGAMSSEGSVMGTPEEKAQLGADITSGAALGGLVGGGLHAIGEGLPASLGIVKDKLSSAMAKHAETSAPTRQFLKSYEMGKQGVNIGSEAAQLGGESPLLTQEAKASEDLTDRIFKADKELGAAVGKSINDATNTGMKFDLGDDLRAHAQSVENWFERNPAIDTDPTTRKAFFKTLTTPHEVTPEQLKTIISQLDDILDDVAGGGDPLSRGTFKTVSLLQDQLDNKLKNGIPAYKQAAKEMAQFRQMVPETLIAGRTPVKKSGVYLGNLKNKEKSVFEKASSMIRGATKAGTSTQPEKERFINLMKNIRELEKTNPGIAEKMGFKNSAEIEKFISDNADLSATIQGNLGINPQEGGMTLAKQALFGGGTSGKSYTMTMANKAGLMARKLTKDPAATSKSLYQATDEGLASIAKQLQTIPSLKGLGEALEKGLQNKDVAAKNAAIFSIMQRPDARELLTPNQNEKM